MKIGLDGQMLLIENPAGAENYTYNLFNALAKVDNKNEYTIFLTKEPELTYFQHLVNGNPNFKCKSLKRYVSWTQVSLAFELIKNPMDLFFSAVHTMPILHSPKLPIVSMVHGLEYTYGALHKNPLWRLVRSGKHEWFIALFSNALIVPSIATKSAILNKQWLGLYQDKINVIPEGVSDTFYKRSLVEIKAIIEKYCLNDAPYLFFVSTIQPRKNIPNMIHAFSLAIKELGEQYASYKLVISGKQGWDYKESIEAPEKYGVSDNVLFLGRTPDADLPGLLSGAHAFLNFSFEEGFGLPLLEAMACEVQCVVSDIPAYRETGDDDVTFVNPHNITQMKEAILNAILHPVEQAQLRLARVHTQNYSWTQTAKKTLDVFERVYWSCHNK